MIDLRWGNDIAVEKVIDLFRASGIRRPVDDADRIGKMVANANLVVSAWDGDRLVGIARALTDFSYCCYLSDLGVDRDYQHQGLGKKMINMIRDRLGDTVTLLLLSAPESMEYYPKVGFDRVENGWIIRRMR